MGAILDKPLYSFIVNPKIKTPSDLKGKRVGVTRIGSTPDALARAMLKMWNLDPATDVTIVQLNELGLMVQGLVSGVIDAAPISIPSNIRAKNLGYTELFDMTKIGKTYITGTVVTRKRFIDGQRDTAKRFMRAFLEGMKTYLEDEDFSIKVIQKPICFRRRTCCAYRVPRSTVSRRSSKAWKNSPAQKPPTRDASSIRQFSMNWKKKDS
ncbi:MAG: hypothetical protein E6J73_03040 [Deltaproteobacteria bacterium]|nr:MAG: hypothetical protein E6J73_03040 [Deltaproteobacteria bacterium]